MGLTCNAATGLTSEQIRPLTHTWLTPVVNYTDRSEAFKTLRSGECRQKIISLLTPVICVIMYWTVSSVKLLNNVVVGTGIRLWVHKSYAGQWLAIRLNTGLPKRLTQSKRIAARNGVAAGYASRITRLLKINCKRTFTSTLAIIRLFGGAADTAPNSHKKKPPLRDFNNRLPH